MLASMGNGIIISVIALMPTMLSELLTTTNPHSVLSILKLPSNFCAAYIVLKVHS